MAWVILVVAGLFEIAWAVGLKYTDGFTKLWPSVLTLIAIAASMYLLAVAARTLPIGTSYAIWVGIGVAGTTLAGFTFLDEPVNAWRIFFVLFLMISVTGLKLTGS